MPYIHWELWVFLEDGTVANRNCNRGLRTCVVSVGGFWKGCSLGLGEFCNRVWG
jgi:Sec-independent protein secretion pathway component TatC